MKRRKGLLIFILFIAIILIIAASTKPTDKRIKIDVVNAIWGNRVPDMYDKPDFYEQFMNTTTQDIGINDWLFLKRITYTIHDTATTIGFAAFGKVMLHK
jgi:hypothetical protein